MMNQHDAQIDYEPEAERRLLTLREIGRRVRRDVGGVHCDVHIPLRSGVIDKTDNDRLVLPYQFVKFDFMLDSQRAA